MRRTRNADGLPVCLRGHVDPPMYRNGGCKTCSLEKYRADPGPKRASAREARRRVAALGPVLAYRHRRDNELHHKYKIRLVDYERMLAAQDGHCALCPATSSGDRPLSVDHDHTTGRIRGLLCRKCNTAIGSLGDDVAGLLRALVYVTGRP